MKIAIAASLIASAAAFAPASKQASSSAIKSFENELGVIVSTRGTKDSGRLACPIRLRRAYAKRAYLACHDSFSLE